MVPTGLSYIPLLSASSTTLIMKLKPESLFNDFKLRSVSLYCENKGQLSSRCRISPFGWLQKMQFLVPWILVLYLNVPVKCEAFVLSFTVSFSTLKWNFPGGGMYGLPFVVSRYQIELAEIPGM